jgi:tRNA dimethylallyltransferase
MVAINIQPLIAIVGSTATGKSALAIKIAQQFDGEIISADSWLVRKNIDIGTAKPSKKDLSLIKHHLIDLINADDDFSAAIYKKRALEVINDIYGRNKLPILVGGTGLYIDALLYDYSFLPSSSNDLRMKLNSMSLSQLHSLAIDKGLALDSIDQRNKRRVIRLIETNGMIPTKSEIKANVLLIGLNSSRKDLEENIQRRIEEMFNMGLADEVNELANKYGWDCQALKGIGYHEWKLYFMGNQSLEQTKQRIVKDTLLLAKRQTTWFKRNKSIHWFLTPVKYSMVEDLITTYLNKN